jgi:hypothetical protein
VKKFAIRLIALVAVVAAAQAAPVRADQPWSTFGNATPVKVGNGWAIALTSDLSSTNTDDWYGGVDFTPKKDLTFSEITNLSADYVAAVGGFGGGSPRFQINIGDGNGNFVGNVFVYLGTHPQFMDVPTEWTSSGNLIESTDLRFDTTQVGGTFYDDHAGALELVGGAEGWACSL